MRSRSNEQTVHWSLLFLGMQGISNKTKGNHRFHVQGGYLLPSYFKWYVLG